MKKFFSIEKESYCFEIADLLSIITLLNVTFVLCGFWWAPFLGLLNYFISIILNIKNKTHINTYIIQISLIILNCYFLTL